MLHDAIIPGTDDWWLDRLATGLGEAFPRLGVLRAHFDGTVTVPDGGPGDMRETYRRFVNLGRLNIGRLICTSVTSRMVPTGFRQVGADSAASAVAMARWRSSHMVTQSRDILEEMAIYGTGYGAVDDATGSITAQSVWSTRAEVFPDRPWETEAAIIVGRDLEMARDTVILLRNDGGRIYSRTAVRDSAIPSIPSNGSRWFPGRGWSWMEDPQPIDLPQVPIVRIDAPHSQGQFEPHLDALDRINHTIFQRLVITVMQAYRQRWISGDLPDVYPDDHPLAGQPIPYDQIFKAGPAAMWRLPADTSISESAVTDITPLLSAVKDDLRNLAAASSTPLYVLDPSAAEGSAEGASLLRETLVDKVEDLTARAGDGLSQLVEMSLQATGDGPTGDLEVIWRPADRASIAERAQSGSQANSTLPKKTIWREIYQFTPDQITAAEQDEADEAFSEVIDGSQSAANVTAAS